MRLIIDADACPVKDEIVDIAGEYAISVILISSICHEMPEYDNVQYQQVDNISQAVDLAIMNEVKKGDVVVTGDYGLAAMVMGKGALVVSFRGKIFKEEQMDGLLENRYIQQKFRRAGGRTKGPAPFSQDDRIHFSKSLEQIIQHHG